MQREAVVTAIRRHDMHAGFAAERLLQYPAWLAGVEAGQGDVESDYRMEFARSPCNRLGHRERRGSDRGSDACLSDACLNNACLKHRMLRRLATSGGGNITTLASGALTRDIDQSCPRKECVKSLPDPAELLSPLPEFLLELPLGSPPERQRLRSRALQRVVQTPRLSL
jgi:hypothetical protein